MHMQIFGLVHCYIYNIHICISFFFHCCLVFSSHSRIFPSYGDVTITGEGLNVLTYARHSWRLSSEASLACHTYCDTGHPLNNGHLRGPMTLSPYAELPTFRLWDEHSNPLGNRRGRVSCARAW